MKKTVFLIMVIMAAFSLNVYSADTAAENSDIVEVNNKFCPISKEEIGAGGMTPQKVIHKGKSYNLCCAMCKKDFMKDPDMHAKILEEQVAAEGVK